MKALAMAGLLLLAMSAACFAGVGNLFSGKDAEWFENPLEWMIFNPQGEEKGGKTAYIVGGVRCPYTLNLIKKSIDMADGVQLRWIFPFDPRFSLPGTGYLITDPLPEGFIRMGREKIPNTQEQDIIARFNAVLYAMMLNSQAQYPLIFFNTKNGLRVTSHAEDVINETGDIIPFPFPEHDHKKLVLDAYQKELTKKVRAENSSKETMHAYVLPDVKSPSLDSFGWSLEPGHYKKEPCFDYDADFFVCLMDEKTRYFLKKNK